jgi:hypothetical protein
VKGGTIHIVHRAFVCVAVPFAVLRCAGVFLGKIASQLDGNNAIQSHRAVISWHQLVHGQGAALRVVPAAHFVFCTAIRRWHGLALLRFRQVKETQSVHFGPMELAFVFGCAVIIFASFPRALPALCRAAGVFRVRFAGHVLLEQILQSDVFHVVGQQVHNPLETVGFAGLTVVVLACPHALIRRLARALCALLLAVCRDSHHSDTQLHF